MGCGKGFNPHAWSARSVTVLHVETAPEPGFRRDVTTTGTYGDRSFIAPLTSLRFFAAFAVVIYHSGATYLSQVSAVPAFIRNLLFNGYIGVTFFFVLSGYILQVVYHDRAWSHFGIKAFYQARFARIYPVYLIALLLIAPFMMKFGIDALPQFFLLQKWGSGWLGEMQNSNMPAWTLSVELFFYLCFPIISSGARRLDRAGLILIVVVCVGFIACTASSSVWAIKQAPREWMRAIPLPMIRLPEFIAGVVVAQLTMRGRSEGAAFAVLGAICVLFIVAALTTSPYVAAVGSIVSVVVVGCIPQAPASWISRGLSWRPLVVAGGASYALYLLQQPVHFITEALLGTGMAAKLVQFPLLFAASALTFFYIEERAREAIRAYFSMRESVIAKAIGWPRPVSGSEN